MTHAILYDHFCYPCGYFWHINCCSPFYNKFILSHTIHPRIGGISLGIGCLIMFGTTFSKLICFIINFDSTMTGYPNCLNSPSIPSQFIPCICYLECSFNQIVLLARTSIAELLSIISWTTNISTNNTLRAFTCSI
jgi:hypothetical protein